MLCHYIHYDFLVKVDMSWGWITMLSAFLYKNYTFVVLELVKAISDVPVTKCLSLVWGVRLVPVWGCPFTCVCNRPAMCEHCCPTASTRLHRIEGPQPGVDTTYSTPLIPDDYHHHDNLISERLRQPDIGVKTRCCWWVWRHIACTRNIQLSS